MAYDLVVKNALIVDGTGNDAYHGDVAVSGGTIAAVGKVDGGATRTIDVDGQVVAPGFIDAPHALRRPAAVGPDREPVDLARGDHRPHGQLRILTGTRAPEDQDYLMGLFSAAEEVPKAALERFAPLRLADLPRVPGRAGARPPRASTCSPRSATARCAVTSWVRTPSSAPPPTTRSPPWCRWSRRPWTPARPE